MAIKKYLKKAANLVSNQKNAVFRISPSIQEKYISGLREPKDNIDRSYLQYKCQMKLLGFKSVLVNVFSLPLLLLYYVKRNESFDIPKQSIDAVFLKMEKLQDVIPNNLKSEFKKILVFDGNGDRLSDVDREYLKTIARRYPLSWHFLFKCLLKIRIYSFIIHTYSPKAILVCGEYSFTSSVLTDYCNSIGVQHIDMMHGEKLFYIRDSFFKFNRCYVWDESYIKLFKYLRADPEQFRIGIPNSLVFKNKSIVKCIDYTYYLANEDKNTLCNIYKAMSWLHEKGKIVAIRPHPRYSNVPQIEAIFESFEIENIDMTLEESVLRTKNAIGLYTTVLTQAIHNGVNIIVDDISNVENYNRLKELKYGLLSDNKPLLSHELILLSSLE